MATASGDAATASTSMSAPDIHSERSLSASPIAASPSYNPTSSSSSLNTNLEASSGALHAMDPSALVDVEPDAQILEALRSKDRIYVLKLGEQMEALIKERRPRIDLTPSTSYQRLLVHRCSAYYKLSPETDQVTKTIAVYYRSESKIPTRRICELVPAEESTQPAFQIMRRDRPLRGRQYSQPTSTAGEDADTSDVDASEAGSVGGVSSAASSGARRYKTIEEREAEYNEARSRIFMGFEEKKDKEKDMSANSSTFSLVSGSGSTSGGRGSSIGDLDDSASSAPTESEWSGPVNRDKKDGHRGAGSTASSVRSLRSSGASYNANGSGSSRNSRATSPSFTYPTLYEPASGPSYEQGQYGAQAPPPPGYIAHYVYPSYNPPPGQPYMAPYYYPPYSYPPPPAQPSEAAAPGGPEAMYQPPQSAPQQPPYGQPYMWTNSPSPGQPPLPSPHQQHPPQQGMPPPRTDGHTPAHPMPPPMQNVPPYPPYGHGPAPYGYGMPGYYQQPYQPGAPMGPPPPPPSSMPGQMYHPGALADPNANHGNGMDGHNISRTSSRNSNGHGSLNGKRGGPRARGSWTYGPGVGTGGFTYTPNGVSNGIGASDAYGPRLSTNMRRTSGASSGGSAGARTPADETSSTASSSTTSSSSRRTFTSTSTSSKHPLPARPDWAVGLKPQHSRHHDHHNAANRTLSPARMGGGPSHLPSQQHPVQPVLQPNDFPPLSSAPQTRPPVVGGAWTNASMSRVMTAANAQGTALVHYPTSQQSSPQVPTAPAPASIGRLDEQDPAYERPPPKNAELFNPKAGRNGANAGVQNGRSRANTAGSSAGLVDRMGSLDLADAEGEGLLTAMPSLGSTTGQPVIVIAAGETAAATS
ncbi:hypothetical protein L226DRAFT_569610 [Lentinus tigrinus ALCF2SS1-7]|uniref:SUZ domain-containing protein n=1 Tax=Lentinus tigrinus ALCF2SS1-6 TaxID=1328759 RepID=A0A5C2SJZ3_9APHY|nr:hypothetical protein L227DRAFT_495961 [Lentinus tigrinus ALCF2SS1-6]RPD76335.1 hypothetical protein L226DRAFT_569610 [Lentinus tigrinus ALCF2SS1-7]